MPRRHWHLRIADTHITVLGEAAIHVPDEVIERWPDVPWREMRDMRNFIVHEYFGLNRDVLWGTVRDDLPALIPILRRILEREDPGLFD